MEPSAALHLPDEPLLQAPGAALTLQAVDDLPQGASPVTLAGVDAPRRDLAVLIDRHGSPLDLAERTVS